MTNGFTVKAARKCQHYMTDVKLPLIDVSTLISHVLDEFRLKQYLFWFVFRLMFCDISHVWIGNAMYFPWLVLCKNSSWISSLLLGIMTQLDEICFNQRIARRILLNLRYKSATTHNLVFAHLNSQTYRWIVGFSSIPILTDSRISEPLRLIQTFSSSSF